MAARLKIGQRRGKYGVRHDRAGKLARTIDGILFASKREANQWANLLLLEKAGEVRKLDRQVYYPLHAAGGVVVGSYVADFVFEEWRSHGWELVVADAKGFKTDLYLWKKRHLKAEYNIEIREI